MTPYRENSTPDPEPEPKPRPIWEQDGFDRVLLAGAIYGVIPFSFAVAWAIGRLFP